MPRETALLLVILAVGVFGRNPLVIAATLYVLALHVLPANPALLWIEKHGINIGLTFLTMAVLAPIALGKLDIDLMRSLTSRQGLAAVFGSLLAAWVCARGVETLSVSPDIIIGLIIGSILGATFLNGVPVGPLFGAGLAFVFVMIARWLGL